MIKNATIYRISPGFGLGLDEAEQALSALQFVEPGPTQQASAGFVPPRVEGGALAESIDGDWVLKLRLAVRRVPGDTILKRTDEIAAQIEHQTGRKPGKKQRKELKEQALLELLPMAFIKTVDTLIWLDRASRILLIGAVGAGRTDQITSLVIKALDGLALAMIHTETSPTAAMAHWLGSGEAPCQFTVDRECELKSSDEMKSVVRYGRHALDTDEVKAHILAGKIPTRLALTWRDRVSFVLGQDLTLKKLAFLDVVFDAHDKDGDAFDASVAIMAGELGQLIGDLVEALGGEHALQEAA
jgi:recombination associated protein RdgC